MSTKNTDIRKIEWPEIKMIEYVDMSTGKTGADRDTICVIGNYGKLTQAHGNGKPWYVSTLHEKINPQYQGITTFMHFEHAEAFAIERILDIFG